MDKKCEDRLSAPITPLTIIASPVYKRPPTTIEGKVGRTKLVLYDLYGRYHHPNQQQPLTDNLNSESTNT